METPVIIIRKYVCELKLSQVEEHMKLPQIGGCQCGAIRYEITETPQSVYTCHCTDCQRLTSSAFRTSVGIAEKALCLPGVEPHQLQRTADSGRVHPRLVCPECGTWVGGVARDRHRRV